MRSAQQTLEPKHLKVVYHGHGDGQVVPLAEDISSVLIQALASLNLPNALSPDRTLIHP